MSQEQSELDLNVSQPDAEGDYSYRREFYRDEQVAAAYDQRRWSSPSRQRRNRRKWEVIQKALALTDGVRTILDTPCGTGRYTGHLVREGYEVFGSDISLEMMRVGRDNLTDRPDGWVQGNAEALPLVDNAVDCIMCIRFFLHVDADSRIRILRDFRRVTSRWVIVDYRHRYAWRYFRWKVKTMLGLIDTPLDRVSSQQLQHEAQEAGLRIVKIFSIAPFFSDKWIVLMEKAA